MMLWQHANGMRDRASRMLTCMMQRSYANACTSSEARRELDADIRADPTFLYNLGIRSPNVDVLAKRIEVDPDDLDAFLYNLRGQYCNPRRETRDHWYKDLLQECPGKGVRAGSPPPPSPILSKVPGVSADVFPNERSKGSRPMDARRIGLLFSREPIGDFKSLLQRLDLKSPRRSTVPLLAYWLDYTHTFASFCNALGLLLAEKDQAWLSFEFKVRPPAGRGKVSCTDLMVWSSAWAVAIEAKHKEPAYEVVQEWLGWPRKPNRVNVLGGWLKLIENATGTTLSIDDVVDLPCQLIHRTASVCSLPGKRHLVLYHCFDPSPQMEKYYRSRLESFARRIAAPKKIEFVFLSTTFHQTERYTKLVADWQKRRHPDVTASVRKIILDGEVGTFTDANPRRF